MKLGLIVLSDTPAELDAILAQLRGTSAAVVPSSPAPAPVPSAPAAPAPATLAPPVSAPPPAAVAAPPAPASPAPMMPAPAPASAPPPPAAPSTTPSPSSLPAEILAKVKAAGDAVKAAGRNPGEVIGQLLKSFGAKALPEVKPDQHNTFAQWLDHLTANPNAALPG